MALQTSGSISLSQIADEFNDSAPHSLSEQYGAADGIPSSGAISFSQFYGKSNIITHTFSPAGGADFFHPNYNGAQQYNVSQYTISPGIEISSNITLIFPGGDYDVAGDNQEWWAYYLNGTMYRPFQGGTYTYNFSGTLTTIAAYNRNSEDGNWYGVSYGGITAIDGNRDWTYVNNSTITRLP